MMICPKLLYNGIYILSRLKWKEERDTKSKVFVLIWKETDPLKENCNVISKYIIWCFILGCKFTATFIKSYLEHIFFILVIKLYLNYIIYNERTGAASTVIVLIGNRNIL